LSYHHLFVAVELDNPNAAIIRRAAAVARLSRAKITVATAVPDLRSLYRGTEHRMHESFDETMIEAAEDGIDDLCRKAGVKPAEIMVLRGDPDSVVAREAHAVNADLIVFGNHDRHGLDHYVGGFGVGLLHRADCDLLAVNLAAKGLGFSSPLTAVAGDDHDARVLWRARKLSTGTLDLVHVVRPPWREPWADVEDVAESRNALAHRVRDRLSDRLQASAPFKLAIEFETPSKGIEQAAVAGGHDYIIMGSGTHSQLGWHLGSTAHNLLSRTRLDVLLVRPERSAA